MTINQIVQKAAAGLEQILPEKIRFNRTVQQIFDYINPQDLSKKNFLHISVIPPPTYQAPTTPEEQLRQEKPIFDDSNPDPNSLYPC